ncbi:MAG: 3-deoxy-D-manno-octulosonic acid transferase [Nitrospiraceae bacterium]|nr:3-deoxy-D-manno-octulosonic acid transferase [Nitrospiraceae bacterium]
MFFLYGILYSAALVFFLPREFFKRAPGARRVWLREKLGFVETRPATGAFLVHAASVGEVAAAVPFVQALRGRGKEVVLSVITDTGREMAMKRLPGVPVIYMPFDLPFSIKKTLGQLKPACLCLVETEIWPNTVRIAWAQKIPVCMLNGRISEKSFSGYKKARFFMKRIFGMMRMVCVQDEVYAKRAAMLGAGENKIHITGNFKFDLGLPDAGPSAAISAAIKKPQWLENFQGMVIVAGSTHKGEEELVISAFRRLEAARPGLKLVLAPRHPQRAPEAAALLEAAGLSYFRTSAPPAAQEIARSKAALLDTVGELFSAYQAASAAVVGGSFIPHGGQNPLEPAWWAVPVISGPHMGNFPFMARMTASGGAFQTEKEGLYGILERLLDNKALRLEAGKRAREFCLAEAGAVKRTLDLMERQLN